MDKEYRRELRNQLQSLQKSALAELQICGERNKDKIAIAKKQIQFFGEGMRRKIRSTSKPIMFEGIETIVGKLGKLYLDINDVQNGIPESMEAMQQRIFTKIYG